MVAISLYRGKLHRVPDVPRRWLIPRPRISVKEFRGLLRRRSNAFSLLKVGEALASTSAPSTVYNGNPPPRSLPPTPPPPPPKQQHRRQDQQIEGEDVKPGGRDLTFPVQVGVENSKENSNQEDRLAEDAAAEELHQLANFVSLVKVEEVSSDAEAELQVEKNKVKELKDEINNQDPDHSPSNHKLSVTDDKGKRKKEVEEKLEILNKRKHNLVQALKQILSVEEELKRRSSMQPTRPSVPIQVDISNDSGSMPRVTTPKMASEANAVSNHDLQPRQFPRISSISPSAESALKRPSYFSA